MYWCSTAVAGMRTPAMRPTSMPHMPAAFTSISHSTARASPVVSSVTCTVVQRRPSTAIEVTRACSTILAPRMRAPRAMAIVTDAGSM